MNERNRKKKLKRIQKSSTKNTHTHHRQRKSQLCSNLKKIEVRLKIENIWLARENRVKYQQLLRQGKKVSSLRESINSLLQYRLESMKLHQEKNENFWM